MGGTCSAYGERIGLHWDWVKKPEGKRSLGSPRRRWEDNIKINLQEVGCGVMEWIEVDQDRDSCRELVNVAMNIQVP
jgi:hypothetical protein